MYHYIPNKDFLKRMKGVCSDIINQLVQSINNDSVMTVNAHLVGSGAKNLITQNGREPIDLDYNICIVNTKSINIYDGRAIKEYIRKQFNRVLNANDWGDCRDSKSALTTQKQYFTQGDSTRFSIDLAITYKDKNYWYKLIHQKTGVMIYDQYCWNMAPGSEWLQEKVEDIKSNNLWNKVRDTYLEKKNLYLCRNDSSHPSFIVYIETINEVHYKYFFTTRNFLF